MPSYHGYQKELRGRLTLMNQPSVKIRFKFKFRMRHIIVVFDLIPYYQNSMSTHWNFRNNFYPMTLSNPSRVSVSNFVKIGPETAEEIAAYSMILYLV